MNPSVARGEVYFADLGTSFGHEQGGFRPVLIIQNDIGNKYSGTTIAASITCSNKPGLPTHVMICNTKGLKENSTVLLEQIRCIDKSRLGDMLCILSEQQMHEVDLALAMSLGIHPIKNDPMFLTLCRSCAQSFTDSGDCIIRRADPFQEIKEPCTVCNTRAGYDFEVTRL